MAIKAFFTVERLGPGMIWLPDSLRILIPGQRKHADGWHTICYASEAMGIGYSAHRYIESKPSSRDLREQSHEHLASKPDTDSHSQQIMTRHSTRGGSCEPGAESHDEICL
ncbi:hypothetical protein CaCOL14_003978 [Colletotrichum acutatum]